MSYLQLVNLMRLARRTQDALYGVYGWEPLQ